MDKDNKTQMEDVAGAIVGPGTTEALPEIYFNGFEVGFSLSDVNIVILTNDRRHYRLLLSFTTAKTLLAQLKKAMTALEKHTGQSIMEMEKIKEALDQAVKQGQVKK